MNKPQNWIPNFTGVLDQAVDFAIRQLYPGCSDTIQINYTAPCILPILLQQFDVSYAKPAINLRWITQTETNNHHFEIERSPDGINFEKISTVPGAINSVTVKYYYLQDNNFPRLRTLFYRLKLVNTNGDYSYSSVRSVTIPDQDITALSIENVIPNPVKDMATIKVYAAEDINAWIRITNVLGKQVLIMDKHLIKGINQFTIDMNGYTSGLYLLEISDDKTRTKVVTKVLVSK